MLSRSDIPPEGAGELTCGECKGTGEDKLKTEKARKSGVCDKRSYLMCRACNGNGIDPSKMFRWGAHVATL